MLRRCCTYAGSGQTASSLGSRPTSKASGQTRQPSWKMEIDHPFVRASSTQGHLMGRVDSYDDPDAPAANSLMPAASAIVVDGQGRILLHRRGDNDMWALPGGVMEMGESLGECASREVREETGLDVEPVRIVGIYSDPKHVFAY